MKLLTIAGVNVNVGRFIICVSPVTVSVTSAPQVEESSTGPFKSCIKSVLVETLC